MARERRIRVTPVMKAEPDLHLFVLALLALARQIDAEDKAGADQPSTGAARRGGAA